MKARVEPDICIGCGLCVSACPEVFRMEGDKAVVYVAVIPAKLYDLCRQAAKDCPVEAIKIEER
jgi:ferredoxin